MHRFLENVMKKTISNDNKQSVAGKASKKPASGVIPPLVLGKIYANWCGHCKVLQPKWAIIEEEIPKRFPHNSEPYVYEVEETDMDDENDGLASLQPYLANPNEKVELQGGYPTIFKIVNGKLSYYEGSREIGPIITWAMEGIRTKKHPKKTRKGRNKRRSRRTRRH